MSRSTTTAGISVSASVRPIRGGAIRTIRGGTGTWLITIRGTIRGGTDPDGAGHPVILPIIRAGAVRIGAIITGPITAWRAEAPPRATVRATFRAAAIRPGSRAVTAAVRPRLRAAMRAQAGPTISLAGVTMRTTGMYTTAAHRARTAIPIRLTATRTRPNGIPIRRVGPLTTVPLHAAAAVSAPARPVRAAALWAVPAEGRGAAALRAAAADSAEGNEGALYDKEGVFADTGVIRACNEGRQEEAAVKSPVSLNRVRSRTSFGRSRGGNRTKEIQPFR